MITTKMHFANITAYLVGLFKHHRKLMLVQKSVTLVIDPAFPSQKEVRSLSAWGVLPLKAIGSSVKSISLSDILPQ